MKRLGFVILPALLVFAAVPPEPNPGVVYEIEVTDHEQSPPRVEGMKISVEGPNLKMDMPSDEGGGRGEMIFRGDRGENGEMVLVDHDEQGYYVMDDASMRAIAGQMGAAMGAMEEALKNVPEAQREAMEKMMRERGGAGAPGPMQPPAKPEVRGTGERGTKEGYSCVKYEVFQDGEKIREIWTTDWGNIDGGDEAADAFRGMGAFFEAMSEAMGTLPGGEDIFGGQNPFDEMNFANGFPVVVTNFAEDGSVEDESKLRSARRQNIDPADFEPPSGYKRMSMGPG
jgi:hypothetical protein